MVRLPQVWDMICLEWRDISGLDREIGQYQEKLVCPKCKNVLARTIIVPGFKQ